MSQIAEIEAYCSMQPLSLSADKKFPVCPEYDRQNPFCKEQQKSTKALMLPSRRLGPLLSALVRLSRSSLDDTCTTVGTGHVAGAKRGAFQDVYFRHALGGKKTLLFKLLLEVSSSYAQATILASRSLQHPSLK